jgi:hypothetical protein
LHTPGCVLQKRVKAALDLSSRKTHEMFLVRRQITGYDSIARARANFDTGKSRRGEPDLCWKSLGSVSKRK